MDFARRDHSGLTNVYSNPGKNAIRNAPTNDVTHSEIRSILHQIETEQQLHTKDETLI